MKDCILTRTPLDAGIESDDDSSPYWRRQRISFKAPYNNERVIVFLFLPKNVSSPYQTVVHFPGSEAFTRAASVCETLKN